MIRLMKSSRRWATRFSSMLSAINARAWRWTLNTCISMPSCEVWPRLVARPIITVAVLAAAIRTFLRNG